MLKTRSDLNRRETYIKKFMYAGGGICFVCGEIYPRYLEKHHVLGIKIDPLEVHLCANCHRAHKHGNSFTHVSSILGAIENGFMG